MHGLETPRRAEHATAVLAKRINLFARASRRVSWAKNEVVRFDVERLRVSAWNRRSIAFHAARVSVSDRVLHVNVPGYAIFFQRSSPTFVVERFGCGEAILPLRKTRASGGSTVLP
jgi:hypothetical protein